MMRNAFEALSEKDLTRIFEPFYRTQRSDAAGSGLGLAITKRIVETHGGDIEAANSPAGLRVEIRFSPGRSE
jgi:two-component system sensor histidine kinase CpxA